MTTSGSRHTVEVLDGDTTKTVQVQVGVMGSRWTEIRSGLRAGQTVVLATISDPLPDSATSSSNSNSGGSGRIPFPRWRWLPQLRRPLSRRPRSPTKGTT